MKLVAVIFTFLLLPTLLSASKSYVKVTNAYSNKQLRITQYRLSKMGLRELHKVSGNKYIVYSGPYTNQQRAQYALKKIQRYFPNASLLYKNKKEKTSQERNGNTQGIDKSPFYISAGLSYSSAPSTHSIQSGSVQITEPKNSGLSYGADAGYRFYNNFSIGLGYMKFDASDLVFDNIYATLNYKFATFKQDYTPYFEVLAGYSSLKWNVDPITNASGDSNNDSTSPFLGTEAGILYSLSKNLSLYSEYQCIFMTHTTNITVDADNKSKLQHTTLHSLQIGIHYNF